jgi:penicillin-insensitive murein endopeptidase
MGASAPMPVAPGPTAPSGGLPTSGPAGAAAGAAEGVTPDAPGDAMDEEEGLDEHADATDPDDVDDSEFDGTILDHPAPPSALVASAHSPLADLSASELERKVKTDPGSLGSLSLGAPNHGRLLNGVPMPESPHYTLTSASCAYGTQETIDSLSKAIDKVYAKYPDSQKLIIGHISAKNGGRLRPHKSHQAGRDVDISYFYTDTKNWYAVANEKNLDRARTWAFVKALLADPNVEMIFIDTSIQKLLKEHAIKIGEDPKWLDEVFQYGSHAARPIIRHVKGHATHIHIRFVSPVAQASARIASAYLPRAVQPSDADDTRVATNDHGHRSGKNVSKDEKVEYIYHRARSGDTLDSLARHYGVSVKAIQEANALANNHIKQNATYKIPKLSSGTSTQRVAAASEPPTRARKGVPAKTPHK